MAASEMYDFLSVVTPDYAYTLAVKPHDTFREIVGKNVSIKCFALLGGAIVAAL